jgi:TolA-binding protein
LALGLPALLCAHVAAQAATSGGSAAAKASAASASATQAPGLSRYLEALEQARIAPVQTASVAQLRALLTQGERFYLEGGYDEAAVLLLEALESPRFKDFHDFPEYAAAEHMAGSSLEHLGSLKTARVYLERVVARGPKNAYYGPGVRAYVDVALRLGDLAQSADWLAKQRLSDDAQGELLYLQGRARYDAGDSTQAAQLFEKVGKRSRFYGNAQYFLGVIAAHERRWKPAEQRFCSIAGQGVEDHYSFYVDDRFFNVQDLARLALGRTAHEQQHGDDAFYYYFQVPQDSPRLAAALFESAYASYEAKENDTALDLLDQLETRFPHSAFVDEAAILRGYVALARCDFERADKHFAAFTQHFSPLLDELDRMLQNPLRRDALYEDLLRAQAGTRPNDQQRRTLLALLRVDPEFYRLHAELRDLDAEAARTGGLQDAISAIQVRLQGSDRPRVAAAEPEDPARVAFDRDLGLALAMAHGLAEDLDALRAARAPAGELKAREDELNALAQRLHALQERARAARNASEADGSEAEAASPGLGPLLTHDIAFARKLTPRTAAVRARLLTAANQRAEYALRDLRMRLHGLLQRARIGRIDAVMGSKRRVELQIESLAAGRFPAELRDPLAVQGLLADDEEYWPFEGEDWPDEYEERYDLERGEPKAKQPDASAQGGAP